MPLFFRHKPLVVVKEVERILESPHPHDRRVDETFPLNFPGAEHIEVRAWHAMKRPF